MISVKYKNKNIKILAYVESNFVRMRITTKYSKSFEKKMSKIKQPKRNKYRGTLCILFCNATKFKKENNIDFDAGIAVGQTWEEVFLLLLEYVLPGYDWLLYLRTIIPGYEQGITFASPGKK